MNQYRGSQPGSIFGGKGLRPFIILGVVIILVAIFWGRITITIGPGHAGIVFRQFTTGLDKEHVYREGFNFIAPWNDMIVYEVRQQEASEALEVLSSNMLTIKMDVTVLYHPVVEQIGFLHEKNGIAYEIKIIRPAIRSVVRDVIGRYTPEEINTIKRKNIKEEIKIEITEVLARNYAVLEDVFIRNIGLPTELQDAINRKLKQEQESLEYEFRLEKEQKEAERKKIEAEGTKRFQEIVNQGLTTNYLQWKGIEATMKLAESPNAKVVIIGSGKDGLPIILGNQ